jgi:hypothetical protein
MCLRFCLKPIQWRVGVWVKFYPPLFYIVLEVGVIKPKDFESEWLIEGASFDVNL